MTRRKDLPRQLFILAALFCLCAASFFGCNTRPHVTIEGSTAPRFKISGQGSIQILTVNGPDLDNPNSRGPGSRYLKPFWQIVAESDVEIASLEQSGGIVYGNVPAGFKQVYPENGGRPQPLVEKELFTLDCRFVDGGAVGIRFVIHDGKAAVEGS